MATILKHLLYYVFLAVLSVVAGLILPMTFAFGAIGIYNHDYLKGGALVIFALVGNHMCIRAFEYRKKLRKTK